MAYCWLNVWELTNKIWTKLQHFPFKENAIEYVVYKISAIYPHGWLVHRQSSTEFPEEVGPQFYSEMCDQGKVLGRL